MEVRAAFLKAPDQTVNPIALVRLEPGCIEVCPATEAAGQIDHRQRVKRLAVPDHGEIVR
ncbi:hypothetical protein AUC69_10790 [Methyloceanibacter superfactus]|uniref:Uncharacterized protein n=1 Tax=Methyloceanibacter superfactus TaxID=1774969 RepID=A0A1E3VVQ8_9HYPH|nr:hypothetical protein AUC69_10790 [Methyloceanibacter superfactus]